MLLIVMYISSGQYSNQEREKLIPVLHPLNIHHIDPISASICTLPLCPMPHYNHTYCKAMTRMVYSQPNVSCHPCRYSITDKGVKGKGVFRFHRMVSLYYY